MAEKALKINYKTPKLKLVKNNNIELILLPPRIEEEVSEEKIVKELSKFLSLFMCDN